MKCKNCKTKLNLGDIYYCEQGVMKYKVCYEDDVVYKQDKFVCDDRWYVCKVCGCVLGNLSKETLKKILKKGGAK